MNPRALASQISIARMGFGVAFMLAPSWTGGMWIGPDASRPGTKLFIRALGARDFALGLGTLLSMRHDRPTRGWLEASGLADFADSVVTLMAGDDIPVASKKGVPPFAAGSAALCGLVATRVDLGREQVKHASQA
jgi:hypothetical protein